VLGQQGDQLVQLGFLVRRIAALDGAGHFNVLTMNARCYPGTSPLIAQRGERVRIRFGNLSAIDHHPIHLHGYAFTITETDGGAIPASARHPDTTVLVPTGSTPDGGIHCRQSG
jgi:FtsP/CotA-like multicopper oxidase with cupredoxin domain